MLSDLGFGKGPTFFSYRNVQALNNSAPHRLDSSPSTVPQGYCRALVFTLLIKASSRLPTTANGISSYNVEKKHRNECFAETSKSAQGVQLCEGKYWVNTKLKQRHFWVTNINWKCGFFPFNVPWHYPICISKCLYFMEKIFVNNWTIQLPKNAEKVHFWLTRRAQRCLCLFSLMRLCLTSGVYNEYEFGTHPFCP